MILAQPYDDHLAMTVFRNLDGNDIIEAQQVRGDAANHLALFCEWRSMQPSWVASYVLCAGHDAVAAKTPFAVVALGNTGQAGVAQAAFLARDHSRYRLPIARAAVMMRAALPEICADLGIHRIECRCYQNHPTAPALLRALGFTQEAVMPGFGRDGQATFVQFAFRPAEKTYRPTPTEQETDPCAE